MEPPRWKIITQSQYEWERRGLDFIRKGLPDHEPYRAWAKIGRDVGVWREYSIRQPHDGVEVELFEQFLFDAGADAIAEKHAIGHDHAASAAFGAAHGTAELSHDEL